MSIAHAATSPVVIISSASALQRVLCAIFGWMFYFLITISIIMVMVAAFYYVTSNGDPEKVGKATKTITYAAIGIAVALISSQVPVIIGNFFGQSINGCGSGSTEDVHSTISFPSQ